ncbi:MAG: succinyl-diaminopimelate desuccinylase [Halothiobacillaceae bacterium]
MSDVLKLAFELIARRSITPEDAGCQTMLAARLEKLGFHIEWLHAGPVTNLWARRAPNHGRKGPLVVLAGHTDVVPPGREEAWTSPPFQPTVRHGLLYGRGAADMKGGIAALVIAAERFVQRHPDHAGSLAFLLTSDEEGEAINGTLRVIETLERRGEKIDYAIVGEPTSRAVLGDEFKIGRRGSLTGNLIVRGVQGHVAYPHLADNPVHRAAPALAELVATVWDEGNEHFPPTSFQIANIHAGTGANNVIPGELFVQFNFRFNTEWTAEALQAKVEDILTRHTLNHTLEWHLSGLPFLTRTDGRLVEAVRTAVRDVLGIETMPSTSGGTSDARFIAPTGAEVIELGPLNATIHKVDECVDVEDLDRLATVYERILDLLLLEDECA